MSDNSNFKPGNYIKLNVGGKRFLTSYSTLTKYDSMLKTLVTGQLPMVMDEENHVIIDRDGTYFNLILNFMRDGETVLPENDSMLQMIRREAEFYSFQHLIDYLNDQRKQCSENEEITIVKDPATIMNTIRKEKKCFVFYYDRRYLSPSYFSTLTDYISELEQYRKLHRANVYYFECPTKIDKGETGDIYINAYKNGKKKDSLSYDSMPETDRQMFFKRYFSL